MLKWILGILGKGGWVLFFFFKGFKILWKYYCNFYMKCSKSDLMRKVVECEELCVFVSVEFSFCVIVVKLLWIEEKIIRNKWFVYKFF